MPFEILDRLGLNSLSTNILVKNDERIIIQTAYTLIFIYLLQFDKVFHIKAYYIK